MNDETLNHPLFHAWVKESVGALKGLDKTGGVCSLCHSKCKRLIPHQVPVERKGDPAVVRICLPCNRMMEKLHKQRTLLNLDPSEAIEETTRRARVMTRIRMLHRTLMNNCPPILVVGVFRSVYNLLCKDPGTKEILDRHLERKEDHD